MIDSYVKTKEGRQPIKAYTPYDAPLPVITFRSQQKNHKITKWSTTFLCLDTETSHTTNVTGWIYQWAVKFGGVYIYGRRPSEIIDLLTILAEHYNLDDQRKMIIYIHNASYDLQYLKEYLYKYDPTLKVLAIDSHSIIQVDMLGFRILCSYKLTNLSLSNLSDSYATTYIKAVGEIDYSIVRYQNEPLGQKDWFYMFSDVASQYDGIMGYLKMQGYRYAHEAPITSTGFVRANCRKAARSADYRAEFVGSRLTLEQYNLCRQAFMGGVCIASFMYSGDTVRSDKLRHVDFTSSYPARQMLDYFPTGAPSWYGDIESKDELNYLLNNYCCVFVLTAYDIHIKKGVTAPCIPSSKCIHIETPLRLNGKVVSASNLTMVCCELDYKWIMKQYDIDGGVEIDKMLIFERGEIPDWMKEEVFSYFKYKCTLKGIDDLLYNKSKNMLNSVYGMTATAIIRDLYKMSDKHILEKKPRSEDEAIKALDKYYSSYNSFMPYQFSIYTTAHARDALYTAIECVGYDNFLYCDTDSVFYIETDENRKRMEEYRSKCIERAIKKGAYVDDKYLGEPTPEPAIKAFRALHSKCYAMEEYNKKTKVYELNVVIAGIPKRSTKWIDGKPVTRSNAEELGDIDKLEDGFIFSHCGGTRCVYNERPIETIKINGHYIDLSSSAVIENIEKEISDTMYTVGANYEILNIVQDAQ